MTSDFRFNFRVNSPVTDPVRQAFSRLLEHQQACFETIANERMRLEQRVDQLNKENASLRASSQKYQSEANRYMMQLQQAQAQAQMQSQTQNGGTRPSGQQQGQQQESKFKLEKRITIHEAPVHSVAMPLADNTTTTRKLATASWDATVKLYDLQNHSVVRTLGNEGEGRMGGLYSVAFAKTTPDLLGCTSCDHSVYVWNHTTGKLDKKLQGHSDEVNGIDFHSSQQVMCTASDDQRVIIWDFSEGHMLRTLDQHTKAAYGCTFLGQKNEYLIATCCFDQLGRIFDMRDKSVVAKLELHRDDIIGINYSDAKNILATGSDDGCIGIWDCAKWKVMHQINTKTDLQVQENEVKRVAFSPDGSQLAAACSSGRVLVYDITGAPTLAADLAGHTDCVFDVAWSVDPKTKQNILVSASHDKSCQYWKQNS